LKTFILGLCLSVLIAATCHARQVAIEPAGGWVGSAHVEAAFEHVVEEQKPIAVMFAQQSVSVTSCPKCVGPDILAEVVGLMHSNAFNGMVRVLAQGSAQNHEQARKLRSHVDVRVQQPAVYIADPNLNVLGVVHRGQSSAQKKQAAGQAREVLGWIKSSHKLIGRADDFIEAGRFTQAVEMIEKIQQQEQIVMHKLDAAHGKKPESPDAQDQAQAQGDTAPKPVGRFFPEVMDKAKERLEQINTRVAAKD